MTDKARGLLPCPFCGGEAARIDFGPCDAENEGGSCVSCTKCQASGPVEFGFKENFIKNWNTRAALRTAPEGWVMVRAERLATWIDSTDGFSEVDVPDTFAAHLDMLIAAEVDY